MDALGKIKPYNQKKSIVILGIGVSAFLLAFVVLPLLCVLIKPEFSDYAHILSQTTFKIALKNTLLLSVLSSLFSVLVGYLYAYGVVYAKIPCKKFFVLLPLFHLVLPPSVSSLSFILLLGKSGFITKSLLGLDISLYGIRAVVISQVMCFFPIAYIICYQHLKHLNHTIESAAASMGAKWPRVFLLTARISKGALLQSFFFIAVLSVSDFGNPAVLAGRFRVLALEIYTALTGWIDQGASAVYAVFLLLLAAILFAVQYCAERSKKNAVLQFNTANNDTITALPRIVNIAFGLFCLLVLFSISAQVFSVVAGAFQNVWGTDTSFTLKHISKIPNAALELKNSLLFAFTASIISTIISTLAAYLVIKTGTRLKWFISSLIKLPSATPSVTFGLGFVITASLLGFNNSSAWIIIAMTIGFAPFSYRIIASKLSELSPSLDEASLSCGASGLATFFRITFLLLIESLIASFLYTFVRAIGTLSAVVFLVSFDTPLVSVKILNLVEQGFWGDAAALSLFLMLVVFLILSVLFAILKMEKKRGRVKESFIFL